MQLYINVISMCHLLLPRTFLEHHICIIFAVFYLQYIYRSEFLNICQVKGWVMRKLLTDMFKIKHKTIKTHLNNLCKMELPPWSIMSYTMQGYDHWVVNWHMAVCPCERGAEVQAYLSTFLLGQSYFRKIAWVFKLLTLLYHPNRLMFEIRYSRAQSQFKKTRDLHIKCPHQGVINDVNVFMAVSWMLFIRL